MAADSATDVAAASRTVTVDAGRALAEIVARAREGDRDAFAELYRTRVSDVGRYVGAIVRDVHVAEDAVAQTFLLAWRDLPRLREAARFDAWLFRIAHNQAIAELRRRRTVPLDEAPEAADPGRLGSPAEMAEGAEDARQVRSALMRLNEEQRAVLVLRFLRGLPHAEVAAQLGKTEQAARALQYRALNRLRGLMGDDARPA